MSMLEQASQASRRPLLGWYIACGVLGVLILLGLAGLETDDILAGSFRSAFGVQGAVFLYLCLFLFCPLGFGCGCFC